MRRLLFFFLFPVILNSQEVVTSREFFSLASKSQDLTLVRSHKEVTFPWINRYELRTETRDFDLNNQEYTFRVSPNTASVRRAQMEYYNTIRTKPDFYGQERSCDLKLSLNEDWLSLYVLNENIQLIEELLNVNEDRQFIYEKMLATLEIDPQKLLKGEIERNDLEITLNKLILQRDKICNKYGIASKRIDFSDFITIEGVAQIIAKIQLTANEIVVMSPELAYKEEVLLKEIALENSEKRKLIDFAQIKYNGPHSDPLRERFSVGLGMQLFTSGNSKLKMQELQIELEELNLKTEREATELQERLHKTEERLQMDLKCHEYFENIMNKEETNLEQLKTISTESGTHSPTFLLDVRERNLRMRLQDLENKEDVYKSYLKYLEQSNEICETEAGVHLIRS